MGALESDELKGFLAYVVAVLEDLKIPYMIVGGFAAILYGELRFTADVDIVVDMRSSHIQPFVEAFPVPAYYANEQAIQDSLQRKYPFNVIQMATGAKVDLVPLPDDVFTRIAFQRRLHLQYDRRGEYADFITPEDAVLAKLVAFQNTDSEKHLRDALGILVVQWGKLDMNRIRRGAQSANVTEDFEQLLELARREVEET